MDRKSARGNAPAPSRRTPVKAPSGGQFPWMPVGIAVGAIAVIGLIVYLIFQSATDSGGESSSDKQMLHPVMIPARPAVFVNPT